MGASPQPKEISVSPRTLARVHDAVITVNDVMKKMDLVFYQQYPQFRSSPSHRLEFYKASWKRALQELFERRLIMMYAEENKMEVGHGDIREEMEELFGPNVLLRLYEAGVSLDDAYDMVRQDIMMRRLLQFYVRIPALASITPQKVKERFEQRYVNKTKGEKVSWQLLSLKAPEATSEEIGKRIVDEVNRHEKSFEQVQAELPEGLELTLSQPFVSQIDQLSPQVQQIIEHASLNTWTSPIPAKEQKKGGVKWNSYLITGRIAGEKIPFNLVENEIVEELMQPVFEEKRNQFIADLQKKYDATLALSDKDMDSFQPFVMK